MKVIQIGTKKIGNGYPTFIVAEMAWSHDGSVEKAKKIIEAAANANVDAICFHITSLADYMVPSYKSGKGRVSAGRESLSLYRYLKDINLGKKAWRELFSYAKKLKLLICAMCNDLPSVNFVSKLKPDAYIISLSSITEEELIRRVAREKKPIFLRISGAFLSEVEKAISLIRKEQFDDIVLIYGFQSYPTRLEDINLARIRSLKAAFSLPIGFADHTDGGSDLALVVPLIALPFGANVIEKHLTHDRSLKGEDFESALNPEDMKKFVQNLREIEKTFGSSSIKPLSKAELDYRQVLIKRVVAGRDLKKGEKITRKKIAFKRADEGIFPDEIERILGKKAVVNIKKDDSITLEKVK